MTDRQPQCGEPGYQRCPDCQAHRSERHLAGCPVLARSKCHWCGAPMYDGLVPHDLTACLYGPQGAWRRHPTREGDLVTSVMPRCEDHQFPILECSDCAPTPDDLLAIVHDEHRAADELAALAGALVGAVIGGSVMLAVGVLDYLLGKRRP